MNAPASRDEEEASVWERAAQAAALLALDPRLAGAVLRAAPGPARDAWLDMLRECLPAGAPVRRAPVSIGDERLLGGLDLAATLRARRPIAETGLIAQADGGMLILPMAERLSGAVAGRLAGALDNGWIEVARDGLVARQRARIAVVALDEGIDDDERPPGALLDRLAFHLDLTAVSRAETRARVVSAREVERARMRLAAVAAHPEATQTLVEVAEALGVNSLRAPLIALRAARAACALRGAGAVSELDLATAATLVLAPRATRLPAETAPADAPAQPPDRDPCEAGDAQAQSRGDAADAPRESDQIALAAARAALPQNLLAQLATGAAARPGSARSGKSGAERASSARGRPIGARRGSLRQGRLSVIDTLRAAAPWQTLRRGGPTSADGGRVLLRSEDFRVFRFRERQETTAIFVVDASGSSAMQRLAEVKGAIELLLADCYVRRDSVALVAFRGRSADILLAPTRSLVRAKRALAELPGGGGTPLAMGLDAAGALAESVRRKGRTPLLVLMTDGRANIDSAGAPGRAQAIEDALQSARRLRAAGFPALAIDSAPPSPTLSDAPTRRVAEAMSAQYVKLPVADAARLSQAVRAAAPVP